MALRRSGDLLGWLGDGAAFPKAAFHPERTVRASAWGWRVEVRLWRDTAIWVLTPLMAPLMAAVSDSEMRR